MANLTSIKSTDNHIEHAVNLRQALQSLVPNNSYWDTVIICSDGTLVHNRLTVYLLLPELAHCDILNCPFKATVIIPDYSVKQVTDSALKLFGINSQDGQNNIDDKEQKPQEKEELLKLPVRIPINLVSENPENISEQKNIKNSDENIPSKISKNKRKVDYNETNFYQDFTTKDPTSELSETRSAKKSYKGELFPGEYPYKCSFCDKKFKQVGHVNLHERTHTGHQKYICSYCNKRFNQISHLKDHTRIHTGEKPYMCPDCGNCFAYNSALKSHRKIHTGEKSYKCNYCEKTFNQLGNVRTHELLHTGELKFMCTECGKCYNSRSSLKRHTCEQENRNDRQTEDGKVAEKQDNFSNNSKKCKNDNYPVDGRTTNVKIKQNMKSY